MISIVGLGPAGMDRMSGAALAVVKDPSVQIVLRTSEHPAAHELAALRPVVSCDDLYETAADYDALYRAVVERVLAYSGAVAYAVPGSALVGERAVPLLRSAAQERGIEVAMYPGESFIDLALASVGVDPIADGLQILDARDLPNPMPLHLPTLFTQLDTAGTAADLAVELGKVLEHDTALTILRDLGSTNESVVAVTLDGLANIKTGPRASAYLAPQIVGWIGLVHTNRVLRVECPWDRKQTHISLVKHLIEEAYETADVIADLPNEAPAGEPDFGTYAAVEEELGDLLLQVVFHATMASEAGAFDVEEVAEGIRQKLVGRHPHVFGDLSLPDAAAVEANWERLKAAEKRRVSPMDDVPAALPGLARADKIQRRAAAVGFDWDDYGPVLGKLREEVAELTDAIDGPAEHAAAELGDVLFAAVNVARHLNIDAEQAMRQANRRFERRFRWIEAELGDTSMANVPSDQLEGLWEQAKLAEVDASGNAD